MLLKAIALLGLEGRVSVVMASESSTHFEK